MPQKNLRLILVRHGETEENRLQIVQGQKDGELTAAGMNEISILSETLQNESMDAVYSSDLKRAMASANILVANRPLQVQSEPRLREQSYGVFEGKKLFHMLRRMKQEGTGFNCFNPTGGENADFFKERIKQLLNEITAKHAGDCVLLVTHYGVIRMLIEEILRLKLAPTSKTNYYSNGSAIIVAINPDGEAAVDRVFSIGDVNG
jgi:broad specificity phosphatase PhoE